MLYGAAITLTALLALSVAVFWQPLSHRVVVLGLTRFSISNIHGDGKLVAIPGTVQCEDVHYHAASNKLYTACEGNTESRLGWFPGLHQINNISYAGYGKLVIVDPDTFTSSELTLSGFSGKFVTHGIDIVSGADDQTVTILAVNHLPDPEYVRYLTDPTYSTPQQNKIGTFKPQGPPKVPNRSQIEVFEHKIGSNTATWIRSVQHGRVRSPNDIHAISPTSFYVTNDHFFRVGMFRELEDLLEYNTGAWSDVVHVTFSPGPAAEATEGVDVSTAISSIHNPNGMGHTTQADEVLVTDASGGELYVFARNFSVGSSQELRLRTRIQLDSTVDNPSYYDDPYATAANNASGYVIAGLPKAHELAKAATTTDLPVPANVWYVRETSTGQVEKRVIFQDDGTALRSASAAVLVGIDPAANDGKKQAWLFVTGFVSESMLAVKVDL